MKTNRWFILAGAALMWLGTNNLGAQGFGGGNGGGFNFGGGGGNLDPAQWQQQRQQRRMDNLRDQMAITDDTEWGAIQPLIKKVMDAQQVVQADQTRSQISGIAGLSQGTNSAADLISRAIQRIQNNSDQAGRLGDRLLQFVQSNQQAIASFTMANPEAEAIRKAVQSNASPEEIQAALTKYLQTRKAHQDVLEKAQADLRSVLTLRQEAAATAGGLL
jgi:hypothetical protein